MSNGIEVEFQSLGPISIELPDAMPPSFTVDFEGGLVIEANFGIPGPRGEKGDPGDVSASSIGQLADVQITNLQAGDTLVYSAPASKFINIHQSEITDGGNF